MTNIYILTDGEFVKIGRSKNVEKRLRSLQTGNPKNLKVKYIIKNVPSHFEKHLHEISNKFNISGEWFKFEVINFLENIDSIKELLNTNYI